MELKIKVLILAGDLGKVIQRRHPNENNKLEEL